MTQFLITQPVEGENKYHVAVLESGIPMSSNEELTQDEVVELIKARCGF